MRMGIGLGIGINRSNYAQGIFNAYSARVVVDGGVTEGGTCVDAASTLLQSSSLLLVPSGYKGGKLYAEIPTNGNGDLTWTRGSDAFRTNASGLIQRVPWNLLLNTNTFSSWSLEGGALTSGFTAPDNTSTAYKYVQTTGGLYSGSSTATSGSKTASIWLKSVSGTSITCNLQDGGSGNNTVVTVTGDWQLYTATYTTSTSRPSLYVWGISNASGIYVWHPQLVEGTTAETYLPTTDRLNFPRLSYMYGSCPSVLLEPQRTNLVLNSQDFDNASWTKTSVTVTANTATSPDGTTNADLFYPTTTGTDRRFQRSISVTNGVTYTSTIYAKSSGFSWIRMFGAPFTEGTYFDVSNGTIGDVGSGVTASITSVGNGWYRCSVTQTATVTTTGQFYINVVDANNSTIATTNGTNGILVYGAQLEAGAYPTTYIPTTSATATRVADSFSRNNIYTNGLITSSGGTWFVSFVNNAEYSRDTTGGDRGLFLDTSNTGNTNGFQLFHRGGVTPRIVINKRISGADTILYETAVSTIKIAIKWNGTTADVFANGTKVLSATSFTTTAMEFLNFTPDGVPFFIQQMALYTTPLTDAQCQTLTTL